MATDIYNVPRHSKSIYPCSHTLTASSRASDRYYVSSRNTCDGFGGKIDGLAHTVVTRSSSRGTTAPQGPMAELQVPASMRACEHDSHIRAYAHDSHMRACAHDSHMSHACRPTSTTIAATPPLLFSDAADRNPLDPLPQGCVGSGNKVWGQLGPVLRFGRSATGHAEACAGSRRSWCELWARPRGCREAGRSATARDVQPG